MFDLSTLRTGRVSIINARHGRFAVLDGDNTGIGALLRYYGEFCDWEIRLLCALLDPQDFVVEVGGNVGTHTIPFARHLASKGRLIVYEPQPIIAALLEVNLALNNLKNVEVRVKGVGATFGHYHMPSVNYATIGNAGGVSLAAGAVSEAIVPVEPLDSIPDSQNIKLIKIDVEGMETEVLAGAASTIEKGRPYIYFENNPYPRDKSVEAIKFFDRFNYKLFWDVGYLHTVDNFFGVSAPFFSNLGHSSNILALPAEKLDQAIARCPQWSLKPVTDIHDHPMLRVDPVSGRFT